MGRRNKRNSMSYIEKPTRNYGILIAMAVCLIVVVSPGIAGAQTANGIDYDVTQDIKIFGDRVEIDTALRSVRYIGNVVAVQGEAILNADMVVLRFEAEKAGQKKAKPNPDAGTEEKAKGLLNSLPASSATGIESLVASGRVTMLQGDRRARCEQAIYNAKARTVVLTGSPTLWQGGNFLKGRSIVVHLDTERVIVKGGPRNRVTTQITPDADQIDLGDAAKQRLEQLMSNPAPPIAHGEDEDSEKQEQQ